MANETAARKDLELIELMSAISARAVKQANDVSTAKAAAEAQIDATVRALVDTGCIPAELAKEAAEQLRDHANALEILQNTAELVRAGRGQHLGAPHEGGPKQAAANGRPRDWNGRTNQKRASDAAFEQKILGRTIAS